MVLSFLYSSLAAVVDVVFLKTEVLNLANKGGRGQRDFGGILIK
jgi:hypothetical protein